MSDLCDDCIWGRLTCLIRDTHPEECEHFEDREKLEENLAKKMESWIDAPLLRRR